MVSNFRSGGVQECYWEIQHQVNQQKLNVEQMETCIDIFWICTENKRKQMRNKDKVVFTV